MKIIKLEASNIKRLKAVTIEPQGNTVVISGKNGAGKSSVLDAIWYALGGGPATKDTVRPIRDGQESASVTLDLGEYIVTRTWTANDKSYLKVENRDGARFPSPQAMLDKLVGKLSFDPLAFAQMDERAQIQALMSVVTLEEDPAELDNQRQRLFDERTQVNRLTKQLEGQLAGMLEPAAGLPAEEVGAASIMAEIEHANRQIRANDTKRAEFRSAESGAQTAQAQFAHYDYEIKQTEARLAQLRESYARATKGLLEARALVNRLLTETEALCDPDLSSYRQRLADVEQTNRQVRAAAQRTATSEALAGVRLQGDNLSAQIRAIDER
ncbi:MAG: AAA family ATPase, partial [Coriobacteriia bacterium]|nr:AAA family ATPase [Coriobacteriia bacterium]